jgi:haloacetate dehalogenase
VDNRDERADHAAGRRVWQPLLVLGSTRDDLEDLYGDPLKDGEPWPMT